ncbi:MAG TPA: N-6 DNA methylase [Gemmatimonadaceae bacterium]|nr:N-6 DNA methylase [Gemmatimonadaceae bacterium]
MRTLRAAAQLLADASSVDALTPIASAAGCTRAVLPLGESLLRDLGIETARAARLADGPGAVRALLVELEGSSPLRGLLARIAARLASRTPHVLWLVIATQPATAHVAIVAWRADRRPPRVAALVVDRTRVVDSDAETLVSLFAATDTRPDADMLTHSRWVEVLGREALTRRFYRSLEVRVEALGASLARGTADDRRELAILYSSRLLFLCFLEAKGWLDSDRAFLSRSFDACMERGGEFHRRVLLPLFFGTLNTRYARRAAAARALGRIPFLNGGLFARSPNERRLRLTYFPDDELGKFFSELFARYRFTAREESTDLVELAIDPEMLGKAFESLMSNRDRKGSGSFYTPQGLVARVADAAFSRALAVSPDTCHAASIAEWSDVRRRSVSGRLRDLTILDPACGSGAFLVHALERVAELRRATGEEGSIAEIRRDVLTRSIFGVDKNPTAVWLCELRLWLSVVIESPVHDPLEVRPLPNLDRNIRVGDSLAAGAPAEVALMQGAGTRLRPLRERYARASGRRKESLVVLLDREERRVALANIDHELTSIAAFRRDLIAVIRGRDLFGERAAPAADVRAQAATLRARAAALRAERRQLTDDGALPFSFAVHFADVATRGGFDIVLGNPPWVRLHRVPPRERELLRAQYRVFRAGAWESGAARARAGRGFAAQVDLAALFVERAVRLLRPGAVLAFLLPMKLWQSLAGGGVRRLLVEEMRVLELEDLTDAPSAFDAAVYPSLLVAERWSGAQDDTPGEILAAAHHRGCGALRWRMPRRMLSFDDSAGSPWLVLPSDVRAAFDRLRASGVALSDSGIGRPHLGVKSGFNLAFVVRLDGIPDRVATVVAANGRRGLVEYSLLRPALRGEDIDRWQFAKPHEHVVWTHAASGAALDRLPPHAARWLTPWRRQLAARADARDARWWSLFRVDGARQDRSRVVWADLGRGPRATVLPANDCSVPLNSCYVAICQDDTDALTLTAILNSPLAEAWLAALAEPARGGYRRFLGWTMALLPLPLDWKHARAALAPIAERAMHGEEHTAIRDELSHQTLAAYRVRHDDMAPLLSWFAG